MSMETASGTYGSENRSVEEMTRYLNGLKRYTEKGIPIYMDGKLSGQREWEKYDKDEANGVRIPEDVADSLLKLADSINEKIDWRDIDE